jgi:hypothetical protein
MAPRKDTPLVDGLARCGGSRRPGRPAMAKRSTDGNGGEAPASTTAPATTKKSARRSTCGPITSWRPLRAWPSCRCGPSGPARRAPPGAPWGAFRTLGFAGNRASGHGTATAGAFLPSARLRRCRRAFGRLAANTGHPAGFSGGPRWTKALERAINRMPIRGLCGRRALPHSRQAA